MPRSPPPRRMPCTCRRTSSPASAIGRSRSIPTWLRGVPRRKRAISTTSCMPWTTWSMPICSSGRTRKPRTSSTRWRQSPASPRTTLPVHMRGPFRRRGGGCPLGRSGSRQGRHRQARRIAGQAQPGQGRLLGRAGRYPEADRNRLGPLRRRQARRRAESHECRRRCRGQDREAPRDAGRAQARARVLRRHAAREQHAQGGPRRFRSDAEKGAQPARRLCRCSKSRREIRRSGQGPGVLRKGRRHRQRRLQGPGRRQRRARVPREEVVRALLLLVALGALAAPARGESPQGESLQVTGYAGVLGEWELTATVATGKASQRTREYAGPLTMKHVGWCTQEGPEERTGEIRLQISTLSSRLKATVSVDGVECAYRAGLSDSYTGKLACPGRPAVPLELWVK